MKKLYFSSYAVPTPSHLLGLLDTPVEQARVGVIVNAKDSYPDDIRAEKIKKIYTVITNIGFEKITEIDLRNFESIDSLDEQLDKLDVLWVAGGNTFYLRHAMAISGFDQCIHQHVERGLVYAGESAGAVVAGPTLRGVELIDDPGAVSESITDGLHLTDKVLIPHVKSAFIADAVQAFSNLYDNAEKIELTDTQSVTIIEGVATYNT